jgi:RNA polymerase sigma-70 factor (ECF subfamily)
MDPRKLTDEELVRLLLATRDEDLRADLWVEFWRRFYHPVVVLTVRRRIVRRTRRAEPALVEDLAQETFIKICKPDFKVLRNFEFRHENALRALLKVMAAHVVEDYFRQHKIVPEPLDFDTADRTDFRDEVERRRQIEKIENCLQQLADKPNFPRDHKAFWLYYRDGLTALSISQIPDLGFNGVKGVESALLRMIKFLRQCLGFDSTKS